MEMKKLWLWICNKLLNWEWILVKKAEWDKVSQGWKRWEHQYQPEQEILVEVGLKAMEVEILLALYKEISSTKNALLIEQKKYSDPIAIAHRDGAIITVDILLYKLNTLIKSKSKEESFSSLEK